MVHDASSEKGAEENPGDAGFYGSWRYCMTTSGFYGVIIDITDDDVIVEFGNNKNCRIPMQKAAIAQIEKPNAE